MRYLHVGSNHAPKSKGRSERLVLAIDASPSMEDTDWPPSRLEAAIEASIALILRKCRIAPRDHVGVVAYGHEAWCVAPLDVVSASRDRLAEQLRLIETGSGTNITAALEEAEGLLVTRRSGWLLSRRKPRPETAESRRIILLTDGDHNTGRGPESIARKLKREGVCIDCIGIGGDPSDVNEELLRTIASTHADGARPRYTFIGDRDGLIQKFEQLAGRITR